MKISVRNDRACGRFDLGNAKNGPGRECSQEDVIGETSTRTLELSGQREEPRARVKTGHFVALDGWRGVCALIVAAHHFPAVGHIFDLSVVRNAFLFVDYFFVLSGFVIAVAYGRSLQGGAGFTRFGIKRFGRIYPLHLFSLLIIVAVEVVHLFVPVTGPGTAAPFAPPGRTPDEILGNLVLLQSFGIYDHLTWNEPSWSISAEFWVSMLFALIAAFCGRFAKPLLGLLAAISLVCLMAFSKDYMNATGDLGFVRCLLGFVLGLFIYDLRLQLQGPLEALRRYPVMASLLEILLLAAVLAFVARNGAGMLSFAAPFLFGVTVLVFSAEAGIVSWALRTPAAMALGAWSYSIYMMHFIVQKGMILLMVQVIDKWSPVPLMTYPPGDVLFGTSPWMGDAFYPLMLALVIAVSKFTFDWVEVPARDWFRDRANAIGRRQPAGSTARA